MGVTRNMRRKYLKDQWRLFKKENPKFKNMPLAQFKKLWKEGMKETQDEKVGQELTLEDEEELAGMFEDVNDED